MSETRNNFSSTFLYLFCFIYQFDSIWTPHRMDIFKMTPDHNFVQLQKTLEVHVLKVSFDEAGNPTAYLNFCLFLGHDFQSVDRWSIRTPKILPLSNLAELLAVTIQHPAGRRSTCATSRGPVMNRGDLLTVLEYQVLTYFAELNFCNDISVS